MLHALQARGVCIDGGEIRVPELGDMCRLAARRGARVEHAHAITRIEQGRGKLRACVLNRKPTSFKPRKLGHGARARHDHANLADALCCYATGVELAHVGIGVDRGD